MLYTGKCQFFGFHAVFFITARVNHHKTVVGGWDHSQKYLVGGPQVFPGCCLEVSRLKLDVFACFVKKPSIIKRGVWGDSPPILGRTWPPAGVKRGVWGGSSPHSRAYLTPLSEEGGLGGFSPHSRANLGLLYNAPFLLTQSIARGLGMLVPATSTFT